jgi:hypothetical protein
MGRDSALSRRALLAGGLAALCPLARCWAAGRVEADTSPQAKGEAIRSLPLTDLTAETRRKLMAVVERPSIFRRLPQKSIDCDPGLFLFLIRNPEVVVNIWELMGISNMTAQRQGPYLWKGNDGSGTICDVELVYGTDDLHVLYGDGHYEGSVLRGKLTGRCVLILKSGYAQSPDRRWYVGNCLDVFMQIDNMGADMIARTLAPWIGGRADHNFEESCKFATKLSQTAETNGPGMQRLADKLSKVAPAVREEFARLSVAVGQRAAQRDLGGAVRR